MFQKYLIPLCIVAIIYLVSTSDALTNVSAGLAILLFGMLSLGSGFRAFNGGFLENLLTSSTSTAVKSITFGTIATAVMQSSSLVSVLSISFVSAALLSLAQGIGVIFGANLGNSAGSWLIAGVSGMKISALALPLIVGGVLFNFQSSKASKGIGQIFIGIGFFFLGVGYIKDGFEEYKEVVDFSQYAMEGLGGVLLFVGLGALMTAIVQSSHATLTIIISAFAAGSMSYENALAATLGTSVGGVMTAVIASLSTNIDGKRLAVANCIFNFSIALLVIATFDYFVLVNSTISMLLGLEENSVLRIAVFHTLFNLVGVVLLLPLIPKIAIFLESVMKAVSDRDNITHNNTIKLDNISIGIYEMISKMNYVMIFNYVGISKDRGLWVPRHGQRGAGGGGVRADVLRSGGFPRRQADRAVWLLWLGRRPVDEGLVQTL